MPPPPCPFAVIAEGVDLDRLALRKVTEEGRLSGWARLRGVYRDGTLEVTHQWAEQPPDTRPGWESPTPPSCRPPAGGWRREHDDDTTALFQYVDGDRDRFSGLHVTYPGGDSREGVIVMVVGVIGEDPAAVQAELGQHYAGNLCVVPARHSGARLHQASDAVVALSRAQTGQDRVTIYSTSDGARGGPAYDRVAVEMVLLGPALYAELRKIGLDLLALNPWLRPAR